MSVLRVQIVNDHIVGGKEDKEGNMVTVKKDDVKMGQEDDVFLKRLEKNMLSNLKLWGIDNVKKVFLRGGAKKRCLMTRRDFT